MNIFYQEPYAQIIQGDCREVLAELPAESVQMCVTSPPYWGKRKYEGEHELIWGGEKDCSHQWTEEKQYHGDPVFLGKTRWQHDKGGSTAETPEIYEGEGKSSERYIVQTFCAICGAWKGAYGREPTPEMYIEHTIEILRAIRRVLRKDGVVFWNIGDTYFGSSGGQGDYRDDKHLQQDIYNFEKPQSGGKHPFLKPKDLCLIPFRVAIAAQEDGWWVRRDIIWNKTNPKPESVTDRPTTSHDYILMLTKSDEYYWDKEAVREPLQYNEPRTERIIYHGKSEATSTFLPPSRSGRNIRSVWTFPTQSYSGAHFAIFPDELPEICIKAATPEVGCCARCGAPWERITEKDEGRARQSTKWSPGTEYGPSLKSTLDLVPEVTTIGWQPTCNCNADKVPALVLDPFAGTGTTGKVAKILGRKSILIDTSEKYCGMARKRIEKVALPMIAPVEEYYPEVPDWF